MYMYKDPSAEYYQNNKERLKKKNNNKKKKRKRYQSLSLEEKEKKRQYGPERYKNLIKMKNKSLLSIEKINIKRVETHYCNYKKLSFEKVIKLSF